MALYVGMGGGCHPDLLLVVRGGGRADHPLQLQQVQQQHPQVEQVQQQHPQVQQVQQQHPQVQQVQQQHPQVEQVQQQHPQVGNGIPEYCLRVSEQKYP